MSACLGLPNSDRLLYMVKRIISISISYLLPVILLLTATGCHTSRKNSGITSERIEHIHVGKGSDLQKRIVKEAMEWMGTPYAYAKNEKGEGTDCSGMVMTVYESVAGIKIPRNSALQADFCKSLDAGDVRLGDLVFFATGHDENRISHVGIMVDDTSFIHASTKKGVVISDLNTPYYIRTFRRFGRVPKTDD